MQKTNIEWADYTWNPVEGCEKVSQGCKYCYAETFHNRFSKEPFTHVQIREDKLNEPIKKKTRGVVFVNSMSDLFHKDVPFDFIQRVLLVMTRQGQYHTYIILTKRPARAVLFFEWLRISDLIMYNFIKFDCRNIWIGVSIEDQETADERIPILSDLPGEHMLSVEPLIAPVKLTARTLVGNNIKWVIVGGESGREKSIRPMSPDWVRSVRDMAEPLEIPFFFKQWGEWVPLNGEPESFPLKEREKIRLVDGVAMIRKGKKHTGHFLDGEVYRQFPNGVKLTFQKNDSRTEI